MARTRLERVLAELGQPLCIGVASYDGAVASAQELISTALDVAGKPSVEVPTDTAPVIANSATVKLYEFVARAARTSIPVLIQGETGTGKELVARALHDFGARKQAPFKAFNCGAVPTQLVEGILFGHERGAHTGADRQALGLFEQAQGGTLFLDEVGELPLPAQAALLRVLEHRSVVRLGGTRETQVDVRIVAATHRDLRAMTQEQTFREDLLFRLDAFTLDSLELVDLTVRLEEALGISEFPMQEWIDGQVESGRPLTVGELARECQTLVAAASDHSS